MLKSAILVCGIGLLASATGGCSGEGPSTSSGSSGSSGSGGAGGGDAGPPIMYPACTTDTGLLLRGTLDGMPYDKVFPGNTGQLNDIEMPYWAHVDFPPSNRIEVFWAGTFDNDKLHSATGTISFSNEGSKREIKAGSTIVFSHTGAYLMDLVLDNGELLGCSDAF